jgi:nucleoside-diphosphate-sugar epimerase
MQVLITGGAGFLGQRLAQALLDAGSLSLAGADERPISSLVLTDLVAPGPSLMDDARVSFVEGELNTVLTLKPGLVSEANLIVHLAAAVSGDCEADLDLGLHSNLDATLALLQAARHGDKCPVFVYASSVAVFGAMPGLPLPLTIEDNTLPAPQSSYGIQKFTGEQLVADFSRRGLVDGRNVRLMTVAVRSGKPNGAASGFLSGMVREPLAGLRCTVPVSPETRVALATPTNTIAGLMCAVQSTARQWGPRTAVNLPALSTTVGEIAAALERAAGAQAVQLLDWTSDARIESIVGGWPSRFNAQRAHDLGLRADSSVDALLQDYLATVRRTQ